MIRLSTTGEKLQAVLGGAVTTNQLHCVVCYSDDNGTTYVGGTQYTSTNDTTAVDICAAPGASTVRDIDYLSIRNRDTAAATVTVMVDVSATDSEIVKATLAVGDSLVYSHGNGWNTIDSAGQVKSSATGGGVSDGDKGDITVSASGATWTIDNDVVTYAKMQNVSATDKVLGRSTAGAGDVEEIACTAFARSILDDANEATFKATVNLEIGTDVQAYDAELSAIAALAVTDSNIIVGNGTTWVAESGATARTSLGAAALSANTFTGLQTFAAGADIASATTVDLTAATGNLVRITGTTATTGVTINNGQVVLCYPTGAWPLTYHATNMPLPGSANYTCAAGDMVIFSKDGSGVVHIEIVKRDGTAVVAPAAAGGKIKQVVFANKTDTFSTASTSFTDLTGMSVSLTPTSASNKVALFAMMNVGTNGWHFVFFKFLRDSTDILIGDTASSRERVNSAITIDDASYMNPATMLAVDAPGDTSAHTYKVQMKVGSGTGYINRTGTDTDNSSWPRAASMLIAMEYEP